MAKRKGDDNQKRKEQEDKSKPKRRKEEEDKDLKALYAKMRKKFSAADLQKYTEIEEGIPLQQVIAEMEEIQRKYKPKKA
jgi:hypothetical protein